MHQSLPQGNIGHNQVIFVDAWTKHYRLPELGAIGRILLSNKVHNHFLVLFLDVNFFTTFSQLDDARILGRNLDTLWGCICQKNFEFFVYFFVFISIGCFFRSFFIFFGGNKNRHRFLSFTTLKSDDG